MLYPAKLKPRRAMSAMDQWWPLVAAARGRKLGGGIGGLGRHGLMWGKYPGLTHGITRCSVSKRGYAVSVFTTLILCLRILAVAQLGMLLTALVILLGAGGSSSAQQRPGLIDRRIRISIPVPDYAICLVNQAGWMRCTRKRHVRERLAAHLTARESRLVIGAMDDINGAAGNRGASDILVHCMGGWHGVRATAMPALRAAPTGRTRQASALEGRFAQARRDSVRSACTSGRRSGMPGSDSAYERQAQSSVDAFGAAIANCQDQIRPIENPAPSHAGRPQTPQGISTLVNEPNDSERRRQRETTASDQQGSATAGGGNITQSLMYQLGATKAAEAQERGGQEGGPAARQRADELAALEKAAQLPEPSSEQSSEQAEAEAERAAEELAAEQCLVDGQCTEPAPAASMPPPPGAEGGGSTCAARQAWWAAFERRCDGSQWRSWECVAFRRLLLGCVDVRRIYPGPDGDLLCPASAPSDREAARVAQECRTIHLIARRTRDDGYYCGRLPPVTRPRLAIDLCGDPKILADPDHCRNRPVAREISRESGHGDRGPGDRDPGDRGPGDSGPGDRGPGDGEPR